MLLNSDAELTDVVQIPDFLKKSGILPLPSHLSLMAILQSFSGEFRTSQANRNTIPKCDRLSNMSFFVRAIDSLYPQCND
jgi:hypothetical protein